MMFKPGRKNKIFIGEINIKPGLTAATASAQPKPLPTTPQVEFYKTVVWSSSINTIISDSHAKQNHSSKTVID